MSLQIRVVSLLALLLGNPCAAQVVINEILFLTDPASADTTRTYQWVELYNKGTDAADLSKMALTNRGSQGGASVLALPAVSLPGGAYLTINFTAGQNQLDFSAGPAVYFSERPNTSFWSAKMDEAALFDGDKIIDFLAWSSDPKTFDPGAAHDAAVAAMIWTKGQFISISGITHAVYELLRTLYPGDSVGRDAQSTDTDSADDFDSHGGADALDNTPGAQNFGNIDFDSSPATPAPETKATDGRKSADPPARKKWSVLLYFAGDSNLNQPMIDQLKQVARGGGTNADVNFLLLLDRRGAQTLKGIVGGINPANGKISLEPLPGESREAGFLNAGDPTTLADFIKWSNTNFPADRTALIMATHGQGWKGLSPDVTARGPRDPADWLRMGELAQGLAGTRFELIALHACLMGGIEVASQLQPFANYLFFSEEVIKMGTFPYVEMTKELRNNPDQNGKTFSNFIFDQALLRVQGMSEFLGDGFKTTDYTLSLIDLAQVRPLEVSIDTWSKQLRTGVGLLQKRNIPDDNVQNRIKINRWASMRFADDNYVDLDELASKVLADPGIPACVKTEIPNLQKILRTNTVIREAHGSAYPNARGLHIHFPKMRTGALPPFEAFGSKFTPEPYDAPQTRLTDANSRRASYAPNLDSKLPFKARDEEVLDENLTPGDELKAPVEWTRMPSPGFTFVTSVKTWPSFLARYYSPVADNSIIKAVGPSGEALEIKDTPGGACENSIMSAEGPVGSTFTLSGRGSSDADMPAGIDPLWYFWDLDASKPCIGKCIAPTEVPAGADAASTSTDNKDQDIQPGNSTIDDQDAVGVQTTVKCPAPGQITTTLLPWDDNHTFRLHDTKPGPTYVHPQTDLDQSYISCSAPYIPTFHQPPFFFELYTVIVPVELTKGDRSPAGGVTGTTDGTGATVMPKGGVTRSAAAAITTDKFGMVYLLVQPASSGLNSVTVTFPGLAPQKFSFNTLRPNDPAGTALDLSGPSSLTLNRAGTLNATVLGQRGPVSMVSFVIKSGNARFDDNRLFFNNAGTQAFTGSDGTTQVSITPTAGGVVEILAATGSVSKTLLIPVTGGSAPADTLTLSALPRALVNGATLTLTATLTAGTQAVSGVPVVLQISQGDLTIAAAPPRATQFTQTTDAKGQVSFRLTANDTIPAVFSLSATGTKVKKTVDLPIAPAPR